MTVPADTRLLRNLRRQLARSRRYPDNTCPASRHVQMIGEILANGDRCQALDDDPRHVGISLLSVVNSLYRARTRIARLEAGMRTIRKDGA